MGEMDDALQRLVAQVGAGVDAWVDGPSAAGCRLLTRAGHLLAEQATVVSLSAPAGELNLSGIIAQLSGRPDLDGQDDAVLELGFRRLSGEGRTVLLLLTPHGIGRSGLRYLQHVTRFTPRLVIGVLGSPPLAAALADPGFKALRERWQAPAIEVAASLPVVVPVGAAAAVPWPEPAPLRADPAAALGASTQAARGRRPAVWAASALGAAAVAGFVWLAYGTPDYGVLGYGLPGYGLPGYGASDRGAPQEVAGYRAADAESAAGVAELPLQAALVPAPAAAAVPAATVASPVPAVPPPLPGHSVPSSATSPAAVTASPVVAPVMAPVVAAAPVAAAPAVAPPDVASSVAASPVVGPPVAVPPVAVSPAAVSPGASSLAVAGPVPLPPIPVAPVPMATAGVVARAERLPGLRRPDPARSEPARREPTRLARARPYYQEPAQYSPRPDDLPPVWVRREVPPREVPFLGTYAVDPYGMRVFRYDP